MTFAEFIADFAERNRITKKASRTVFTRLFASLANEIRHGESLTIPGFGTFKLKSRKARRILNPVTGDEMKLPRTKSIGFSPSKFQRGIR